MHAGWGADWALDQSSVSRPRRRVAQLRTNSSSGFYAAQEETQDKLDYVLSLNTEAFLERRLQTLVFKLGLAKSIHHARVLIRQRHIR